MYIVHINNTNENRKYAQRFLIMNYFQSQQMLITLKDFDDNSTEIVVNKLIIGVENFK